MGNSLADRIRALMPATQDTRDTRVCEALEEAAKLAEEHAYVLKTEVEPHRVCQNYKQMRNQELASRLVGVVNPHWRGSVRSTAATQVQAVLDRELTRMWNDIEEFHHKFHLDYGGAPRALPDDLEDFRALFLGEELEEYAGLPKGTLVGFMKAMIEKRGPRADTLERREDMLDALVDLVYVALGTAYLHGFNFAEAWRRVQVANMAKVRVERVEDSKRGSKFDVVKPQGWTPPSHSDLVGTLDSGSEDNTTPVDVRKVVDVLFGAERESYSSVLPDIEPEEPTARQPDPDHGLF